MENLWEGLNKKDGISEPKHIVEELFRPLPDATSGAVTFELQKVGFFPEEVQYIEQKSVFASAVIGLSEVPHPDFGYDPVAAKSQEEIRYRLLLRPARLEAYEFELFKFKYSLLFYPVSFYVDQPDFPELVSFFRDSKLIAVDENDLITIVKTIAQSKSTRMLVQRLMRL